MVRRSAGLAAACALAAGAARAAEPPLAGSYKNLLAVTRPGAPVEDSTRVDDFQRLRIKLQPALGASADAQVHYELRAVWGESRRRGGSDGAATLPGLRLNRARLLDLEKDLVTEDAFLLQHDLDRLRLRFTAPQHDLSVGRQAVSWGTTLIWNPVDLFSGFAPTEIDRDEKQGVDVLRWTWHPAPDSEVDVVVEPLDLEEPGDVEADDSSLAVRAATHVGEYEIAAIGGRVARDTVAGADFTGYLRDAGFRGELLHTWVDEAEDPDFFRAVAGVDYGFAVPWNPYLAVEYFFNGLGAGRPEAYPEVLQRASVQRGISRGNVFNVGRNYVGLLGRVMPTPLLSLQATSLWNPEDSGWREFVTCAYSVTEDLDLTLGANFGLGPETSEFNGRASADLYFAFLKLYF